MESGSDAIKEWGFTLSGDRFFVRLRHTDVSTTDPNNEDFDEDGVTNLAEVMQGTNPTSLEDTDEDGLPDDWELFHFRNLGALARGDFDGDGLTDGEESFYGTNPKSAHSDTDGVPDAEDVCPNFAGISEPRVPHLPFAVLLFPSGISGVADINNRNDALVSSASGMALWRAGELVRTYSGNPMYLNENSEAFGFTGPVSAQTLVFWPEEGDSEPYEGVPPAEPGPTPPPAIARDLLGMDDNGVGLSLSLTQIVRRDQPGIELLPEIATDRAGYPQGISPSGRIVGYQLGGVNGPSRGLYWANYGSSPSFLPGDHQTAHAISSNHFVAGFASDRKQPVLWYPSPGGYAEYLPKKSSNSIVATPRLNARLEFLTVVQTPAYEYLLWRNDRFFPLNSLLPTDEYSIQTAIDINDHGVIAGSVRNLQINQISAALLLPFDIEGYKRGTINSPGAKVSKGSGEYGQETVMMENADSEDNATQPDYATAAVDAANDDDLVKVVLRWPKDTKINGVKLELRHTGMEVDPTKTTDAAKYKEVGPSRLNFYKPDGTKLTDADLKIDNLSSPGNGYLAEILNTGELSLFVEGAEKFGMVGNDPKSRSAAQKMGGAMLNFEVTHSGTTSRVRLLVYRGGFLKFRQPSGQPGTLGTFEFRDGKGRVSNTETDEGQVLDSWSVKSGLTTGGNYDVEDGDGHTPPGWYLTYERTDFTGSQPDRSSGSGRTKKIRQGSYVRWRQDDETDPALRYTTNYLYDASKDKDWGIGEPTAIRFKWQLEVIPPTSPANRKHIQIHPDGKQNGTAGCIGVQAYEDCVDVLQTLTRYHALKVKVVLE